MTLRLRQAALLAGVLIAGLLIGAPGAAGQTPEPAATATPTSPPTPPAPPTPIALTVTPAPDATEDALTFAGRVNPLQLPRPARDSSSRRQVPVLTPGGAPPVGQAPRATTIDTIPLGPPSVPSSFDGLDSADNAVGLHPPDPQLAVGPDHVFEMVNITGRIFSKDGATLSTFTLASFFVVPSGWTDFDPKVIYDATSGHFFASYVSLIDPGGSSNDFGRLHIAVSITSNPLDPWNVYSLEIPEDFPDFDGIGLTDDKVTISYNRFRINPNPPFGRYLGVQTLVIEKSELIAGASNPPPATFLTAPDTSLFTVRPAHSLTGTTTQHMASVDNASSSVIHLFEITGTPAGGNVVITNVANPTIATLASPPDAQQLGTTALIATNDNRILETVWRNDRLWASANAACTFKGDSTTRACLKLIEVDTTTNTVLQDIVFGAPSEYYYYPAIRTDSAGNLHTVFTRSSSSRFAEVRIAGRLSGDPANTMTGSELVKAGEIPYTAGSGARRWGDYSGAAVDPADPSCVWVVGEYAKDDGFVGWGTFLAAASFSGGCGGVDIALITDGAIAFGVQALTITVDTTTGGIDDVETVRVVTGPADLFIRSSTFSDGANVWSLGGANGADQVLWEFSPDGTTWTTFTTAGMLFPLASNVGEGLTQDVLFRLTLPTTTLSSDEHSVTVTIVATEPGP